MTAIPSKIFKSRNGMSDYDLVGGHSRCKGNLYTRCFSTFVFKATTQNIQFSLYLLWKYLTHSDIKSGNKKKNKKKKKKKKKTL